MNLNIWIVNLNSNGPQRWSWLSGENFLLLLSSPNGAGATKLGSPRTCQNSERLSNTAYHRIKRRKLGCGYALIFADPDPAAFSMRIRLLFQFGYGSSFKNLLKSYRYPVPFKDLAVVKLLKSKKTTELVQINLKFVNKIIPVMITNFLAFFLLLFFKFWMNADRCGSGFTALVKNWVNSRKVLLYFSISPGWGVAHVRQQGLVWMSGLCSWNTETGILLIQVSAEVLR